MFGRKTKSYEMTNSKVVELLTALKALGQRKLPDPESAVKVARLTQAVEVFVIPINAARRTLTSDKLREAEENETEERSTIAEQLDAMKLANAVADFDNEITKIDLPAITLDKTDMPEEQKGKDGWGNASGVAAIMSMLGPLYDWQDTDTDE